MRSRKIEVLGICASPRKGNSLYLLEKAFAYISMLPIGDRVSTNTVRLGARHMSACTACEACEKTGGECVIKDDFQTLRDQFERADVILYSVPVYHLGIPGQLKCFIDRFGNSQRKKFAVPSPRRLKVMGAISQGSHLFAGQESAVIFLLQHAVLMNCIPVSGDGWESYISASGWTRAQKSEDALRDDYDKGDFDARVAIKACETLAKRCVEMAMIIRAGGEAMKDVLRTDPAYGHFLDNLDRE
ncbi:flavodoxin family protein [bacterium]|nr:flavodoxin family protein [bacterium]